MKLLKIFTLTTVFIVCLLSVWLDAAFGLYTHWQFSLAMTTIMVLAVIWLTNRTSKTAKWITILATFIAMTSIRYWDYDSKKPFMRTFHTIETGMTEKEVRQIMKGYRLEKVGRGFTSLSDIENFPKLNNKVIFFNFMHDINESDWALVYFIDGRVYKTEFSHD